MGIYEQGLEKTAANHVALSPTSFVERSAEVFGGLEAVVHGGRRYTWRATRDRAARLAAALRARWQAQARTHEALGLQLARAGRRVVDARREAHRALGARFVRAAERTLARHADALRRHEQALANLDPQRVLERGYALLEAGDGRALVSAAALRAGQDVVAVLHDGRAELAVRRVQLDDKSAG